MCNIIKIKRQDEIPGFIAISLIFFVSGEKREVFIRREVRQFRFESSGFLPSFLIIAPILIPSPITAGTARITNFR